MRKSRIRTEPSELQESDLDMTPILSLMIVLIPMLLLSAAFVQVKVIDAPLPQFIAEAIAENKSGEQLIEVDLELLKDRAVRVNLSVNGKGSQRTVASVSAESGPVVDLEGVRAELIRVKRAHPTVFSISVNPSAEITYDEIVKVLDTARTSGSAEVQFEIINKESGEKSSTDLMFPEVVFGNLLEG